MGSRGRSRDVRCGGARWPVSDTFARSQPFGTRRISRRGFGSAQPAPHSLPPTSGMRHDLLGLSELRMPPHFGQRDNGSSALRNRTETSSALAMRSSEASCGILRPVSHCQMETAVVPAIRARARFERCWASRKCLILDPNDCGSVLWVMIDPPDRAPIRTIVSNDCTNACRTNSCCTGGANESATTQPASVRPALALCEDQAIVGREGEECAR